MRGSASRREFLISSAAALGGATAALRTVGSASAASGIEQILSLDKVHLVEIKYDPKEEHWLDEDRNHHVACDVTIDGEKFSGANFSEKGNVGSSAPLAEKSEFNVRFGKDRPNDIKKLVLNNAKQDVTFMHEHTAYPLYRAAGLPAPLTAHGAVTLNGKPYGIFVMEEAQDTVFLEKAFGKGNGDGNFYKASGSVEFADDFLNPLIGGSDDDPTTGIDPAKRTDLAALADAINAPDDDTFLSKIRERMNLDAFIVHYALDCLVASIDGATWFANNWILYHNPADDRFVMLPHGIDQAFDAGEDPLRVPYLKLAKRVRAIPDLEAQWRSNMDWIMSDIWDVPTMAARINQVVGLFQSFKVNPGDAIARDVDYITHFAPGVTNMVDARKGQWLAQPFVTPAPAPASDGSGAASAPGAGDAGAGAGDQGGAPAAG